MDAKELVARRGSMDGNKFFSRSAFRSIPFVVVTAIGVVGLFLAFWILYLDKQARSTAPLSLIALVGAFYYPWWAALRYHERIEALYLEGSLKGVEPGSAIDVALSVAAGAINSLLFSCFSAIAFWEWWHIAYILKHCR